jgi:serine/threonine-protein kinase
MNISASLAGSASESIELGDRYSVISKIGQGGSAAVFKVQDKQLNKPFAVKVMRPELVSDDQANLRFKQEAEAAARMTHPNLVSVYGSGITDNKAPYLVMDCLDGKTLAQTLQEEEYLYSERAVDILIQCCEALVHMHMKGVVHRDIKPSNIFLTKAENNTDIVKIVDFGIAKLHSCQENTHLTQTGAVFGSPLYMSPEQCRGETIDFRSDIYSLGCVAYEMLTGVSPFAADNPIKTIIKHINGSVTPPGIAGSAYQIPEALQSIIMRCLETESKLRYQTVDELLHQLKSFITGAQLQTTPKNIYPSLYRRLAASILDGIILSTVIIGAGYLVSIGQHLPFHLYFPLAVSLQDSFGTFIFWLGFWSLIFGHVASSHFGLLYCMR